MQIDKNLAGSDVIRAGKELIENGLIARTWGNISARLSDSEFLITPSGRTYEDMELKDLVAVSITDETYLGDIKPSSEKGVHAVIYALHPEVNFIIHTHQNYATAISVLGADLNDYEECDGEYGRILGGRIPCAKYGMSSTRRLCNNVRRAVASAMDSKCVLMKDHGVVCFGRDHDEAFKVAFTLEEVCKHQYGKLAGGFPLGEEEEYKPGRVTDFGEIIFKGSDDQYRDLFEKTDAGCIVHCRTPYVMKMSEHSGEWRPFVDDQAQIVGVTVRTLRSADDMDVVARALKGRNAVFIRGEGAFCIGADEEDAKAVCMVLEKGCIAAYLASKITGIAPVDMISRHKERSIYVKSYSKLKDIGRRD